MVIARAVVGLLLVAHGAVHALYLAPAPDDPKYPFTLESSWLPQSARRPVAIALIAATVMAFVILALAVWGVPGLAGGWPAVAIVASVLSLCLLITFWHVWLVFGVVIDLGLIVVALIRPGWADLTAI